MFKPGGVLWLMRHEMRITWRNWWRATRARGWGRAILYLFFAGWLVFMGYWVAFGLSHIAPEATGFSLAAISAIAAIIGTLMLSQSLMLITEAMHQRGDLDLLLSSPVPPWRVLTVRMIAVALNVGAFYLFVLFAIFIFLPFFHGGLRWMGMAPSVLALALLVTALGMIVARFLFNIMGPRAARTAAQILAAFIGAAIFLVVQYNNLSRMDDRETFFSRMIREIGVVDWDTSAWYWVPARAVLGEPLALAAWIGLAIALYALAVRWFAGGFIADAAGLASLGQRKRTNTRVRPMRVRGLTPTLVRKEWRLILRDPLLLSQILLPLLYFTPLVFVMWRVAGEGAPDRATIAPACGAFVFIASTLAAGLVWLCVSAEDAPDLITAAPPPKSAIDRAKAIAAVSPVLALLLIPASLAALINIWAGLWLFVGAGMGALSTTLIGVWRQQPGSRKNFRRRVNASLWVNLAQFFTVICWSAATGFAIAGLEPLALIPAFIAAGFLAALHRDEPNPA